MYTITILVSKISSDLLIVVSLINNQAEIVFYQPDPLKLVSHEKLMAGLTHCIRVCQFSTRIVFTVTPCLPKAT